MSLLPPPDYKAVTGPHKAYLVIPFHPNVPKALFSDDDWDLLCTYGLWLSALMRSDIRPFTFEQKHFVAVCKGRRKPRTEIEKVWMKYLQRRALDMRKRAASKTNEELDYATNHTYWTLSTCVYHIYQRTRRYKMDCKK